MNNMISIHEILSNKCVLQQSKIILNHKFPLVVLLFVIFSLIGCTTQNSQSSPTEDWRKSPKYVSEEQFGEDWPFTISEGLVACVSGGGIVLKTSKGNYGLTGFTDTLGYTNIKDSGFWKDAKDGYTKSPLMPFTRYVVRLCS